jgi:hypothetical protein
MNLLIPPVVTFGIISPFNAHALTPIGWTDARYWRGTYMINSVSGEGLNRISISNGEDLVGNPMLLDNTNTFIIDTTPPLVDPGSDVTIDEGTIVEFDGSGSQDSSGIESYEWTFSYDSTSIVVVLNLMNGRSVMIAPRKGLLVFHRTSHSQFQVITKSRSQ